MTDDEPPTSELTYIGRIEPRTDEYHFVTEGGRSWGGGATDINLEFESPIGNLWYVDEWPFEGRVVHVVLRREIAWGWVQVFGICETRDAAIDLMRSVVDEIEDDDE